MSKQIIKDTETGELKCKAFKRCGGCQLQESYPRQLERKQEKANRMLAHYCRVEPIIGMERPYNYRSKVQNVYGYDGHGRIISGVYQSSGQRLVAVDGCFLEDKRAQAVVGTLKRLMKDLRIRPYDNRTHQGLLRHTLIRTSPATGQLMLVLVTATPILPAKKNFVKAMLEAHPDMTTIVQNIDPTGMPLTLGERNIVLHGAGYIEDELCGCRFRISPAAFYQVNPLQTEKLYDLAISAAGIGKNTRVIDAYCGTGTIGIICGARGAEVTGIELNKPACGDAIVNAKLNGLKNIRFYNEDATRFMVDLAEDKNAPRPDVVILDPPRAGATPAFIEAACKLSPQKIVYISCKIESLERDLRGFKKLGFRPSCIQPVDMFPHTTGIETICLLTPFKK